jgi:predicted nuclease of predicted toxin-antitoxin system
MKIKLDENLPLQLAVSLNNLGHDVHTTLNEGLTGEGDREIWNAAQAESRFLITQDLDFSDIRQFAPGTHFGVLLVRLLSPSRKNLVACVETLFRNENVEEWQHCFVVATERKIRVIRREVKGEEE